MATAKLLINGESGVGKTMLLRTLGKETFVVSRDSKKFVLPLPHMLVDVYYDMDTFLFGGEKEDDYGEKYYVEGIMDKLEKYKEKFGKYPENVVIDTVSQIVLDVIESAADVPTAWGQQGSFINGELAKFTRFMYEYLELQGISVIMLNHVIPEKEEGRLTGRYRQFGQGKFLDKGGFYSTTDESILLVEEGIHRVVYTRGTDKLARTLLPPDVCPTKMYVENYVEPEKSKKLKDGEKYFNLKEHLDLIKSKDVEATEWEL